MKTVKQSNYRYIIIALLFFITVANYVDRESISYAVDIFQGSFQLDDTQIGFILGAFGIGYAFTTFLGGVAADRFGPRLTLSASVFFWSLAMIFSGFIMGFWLAFSMRVLLGLAEGPNFPAMTRAVSDWLPESERMRALSYALMSVPIALAIGGPIVSQLIAHYSWRTMFYILGVTALLWVPLWWCLFRNKPSESAHVNDAELALINAKSELVQANQKQSSYREILTNPTLLSNNWAFFVFGYYLFFFMGWLPTYLTHEYHITLLKVGLFTVLPWTLAALMMCGAGCLSDHLYNKTKSIRISRSYFIMISQLLAAVCILPVIFAGTLNAAILFISLAVGFSMSANAAFYAVNIDVTHQRSGTALGIMEVGFSISGFLAPVITGWLVTTTGHFESAFLVMSLLALSSVFLVYFFHCRE